jgi:non-heme chloroperoxidase
MPYFEQNGFSLHYQVVDGALGRDTLFLHGNLASNVWWEPAVEELKKRGGTGRLILAEWRGCGGSREFSGPLDLPTLAQDSNLLLRQLGIGKADLVGHSTGGLIGLHAMATEPERYERALLLDPVAPDGIQFGPEMQAAFTQMSQSREFCATVILGTIEGGNLSEEFRERIVSSAFSVSPRIWQGVPEMLHSPPPLALEKIQQPVLVLHGEKDQVLPLEKSAALAQALPQGRFQILPGRGHSANVEDPALFAGLLSSFFGGC